MATIIHLKGHITKDGKLQVELPPDIQPGDVDVIIQPLAVADDVPWEERPWTEAEIDEMMTRSPKTGAEIAASDVVGAWEHYGITDSVEWVEAVRKKEQQRSQEKWSQDL